MKITAESIVMRAADDMHLHVRQGQMLADVLPHTMGWCGRALIMPNTKPPILTAEDAMRYKREILEAMKPSNDRITDSEPLMTIMITPATTPEMIFAAKAAGVIAGKIYPKGMTTNSDDGVIDYMALDDVFQAMSECGLVACFHGEVPWSNCCLDREDKFLPFFANIAYAFPKLRMVLEHVTTEKGVVCVGRLPENVAATITPHHLVLTIDDVIGGMLKPHHFCKPVAKRPEDRAALICTAISGNPKFFLGTDSAPHPRGAKECDTGCAGVFTAPIAVQVGIHVFSEAGRLDQLEPFYSRFGAEFYQLPLNRRQVEYERQPWTVPTAYFQSEVVPLWAGRQLNWRLT